MKVVHASVDGYSRRTLGYMRQMVTALERISSRYQHDGSVPCRMRSELGDVIEPVTVELRCVACSLRAFIVRFLGDLRGSGSEGKDAESHQPFVPFILSLRMRTRRKRERERQIYFYCEKLGYKGDLGHQPVTRFG